MIFLGENVDPPAVRPYFWTVATAPKKVDEILKGMSEEHRRMVAEGLATKHRFAAKPSFKDGKPSYKGSNTVAAVAHVKAKRGG
jgi:hypothetical protein